jgi:hypothetical protein
MDEKFTCDVSEEEKGKEVDDGGENEPPETFLSTLEGVDTVRKYIMKTDVDDNTMAGWCS